MGRRRNAISSEDSDDDRPDEASASNPGANPQSASKGKKWTPGMSGKEQKARAKEQRFEQHRRKAERERRNEQKRASREQREEHGAVHAETTTAPSKPVGRPGWNVARLDPSQIRRELKRLFGRIEHGGGVSPSSGRAVEVGDVVVVLIEPEIVAQRKSGAEAWSQRLNKRGEKEFGLSDFLALGAAPGSPAAYSYSSSPGGGGANGGWGGRAESAGAAGAGEPPYHTVRCVVARWEDSPEEILWDDHRPAPGDGGGGRGFSAPGQEHHALGDAYRRAHPTTADHRPDREHGATPSVDALALIPLECWERVMRELDARGVCALGATCVGLAVLARAPGVRWDQHVKLFGRPAPPVDPCAVRTAAGGGGGGRGIPGAPPTPAALEELSARRGWAATCASTIAAGAWIPRPRTDERSDEDDEDAGDDGDAAGEGVEFEFDGDDDDFAAAGGGGSAEKGKGRSIAPRPAARHVCVGPRCAEFMLADGATAASCDGDKIKLWFHGGDGPTEAGKRIATLPNPAGTQPDSWTSLASGHGVFAAGSRDGLVTVWDADTTQVSVRDGHKLARHEGYRDAVGLDDCPASALAVLPGGEYVAAAGSGSGVVSLIGVADETFHNLNFSVDVDSYVERVLGEEADPDHAHAPEAIGSIAVHGVDKAYGTGRSAAGWKLWAATTGGRLVAIDPDRLECVEHIRFPVSTWPLRRFALASRGHVLAAAFGGRALLWDTRCASAARSSPVASVGDDGFFWDVDVDPRSVVAMDDWSAWLAHEGCEGVALYDVRMAVGPPRLCQERWLAPGSSRRDFSIPVAEYVAGSVGGRRVGVGCFARGGDGVLVVASSREDAGADARCSVYDGAHHGTGEGGGGGGEDWEYERAKPKGRKGGKRAVKKKYPKRQGGKFRARTAGG